MPATPSFTLLGSLLEGDHASRPAFNAAGLGKGALYSCSDHGLIYQTDGSAWSTYATLGGIADIDTATTAETDTGQRLAPDGAGGVQWTPAASGGLAQSYGGYNTVGGSWQTVTANRYYLKQFTLATAATLVSIDFYVRPSTDNYLGIAAALLTDATALPAVLLGGIIDAAGARYFSNSGSMPGAGRWHSAPIGATLAAGTYWGGPMFQQNYVDIAYDGSGSDQHSDFSGGYKLTGTYSGATTLADSTRRYSIRFNLLS